MVIASKKEVVIQETGEEEIVVVMMTPHYLLEVGAATETLMTPRITGTLAEETMTRSLKRSTVTGDLGQVACQWAKMMITPVNSHHKPPRQPRNWERS